MAKVVPGPRYDRLGQELALDDVVAAVQSNTLIIGKIINFAPKMVTISKLEKTDSWRVNSKSKISVYSTDMVKVDEQAVTMFLLRGPKK